MVLGVILKTRVLTNNRCWLIFKSSVVSLCRFEIPFLRLLSIFDSEYWLLYTYKFRRMKSNPFYVGVNLLFALFFAICLLPYSISIENHAGVDERQISAKTHNEIENSVNTPVENGTVDEEMLNDFNNWLDVIWVKSQFFSLQ